MDRDHGARVWAAINAAARAEGVAPSLRHAVIASAELLSAVGAGLSLTRGYAGPNGGLREPLMSTGPLAAELEELQFTIGQAPGDDAGMPGGGPVLAGDLAGTEAAVRWPMFAAAAVERGVRGVFAFPVGAGAARLGVLSVYRSQAGPLEPEQVLDALTVTDAVLVLALDQRGGLSADFREVVEIAFNARSAEVYQATGVVAAQQQISVTDALARLRAHAYATGRPLREISADIMARRLTLPAHSDDTKDDDSLAGVADDRSPNQFAPHPGAAVSPSDTAGTGDGDSGSYTGTLQEEE